MKLSRSVAARSSTSRAGWPPCGVERKRLLDLHRLADVEHDARAALHDEAEAERLDQPPAVLAGLGRQVEGHLRQVDHHAIGVGEREGAQIDLAREIHDEAGERVVAADPGVGRDRKRGRRRARSVLRGRRSRSGPDQQPPKNQENEVFCPKCHRIPSLRASCYSIRRWLVNRNLTINHNPRLAVTFQVLACHPPTPAVSKGCLRFELPGVPRSGLRHVRQGNAPHRRGFWGPFGGRYATGLLARAKVLRNQAFVATADRSRDPCQDTGTTRQRIVRIFAAPAVSAKTGGAVRRRPPTG